MTVVVIDGMVSFAPHIGISIVGDPGSITPTELYAMVLLAKANVDDDLLKEGCCGGCGPFADRGELSFDKFKQIRLAWRGIEDKIR